MIDQIYQRLNDEQRRAVEAIEGPVMVIAGPGTGKTTVLSLRIANILRLTDSTPDSILALTFTESGAQSMKRKLISLIGQPAYRVNIHTFHGFAEMIINQYPDNFPRIIGSKVITEAEQADIIEKILYSKEIKLLRPFGAPFYYVRPVLSEIHILKRENISPKMLLESIGKSDQKQELKNLELAFVYGAYEAELARRKLYDFDDMLLELIRAMVDDIDLKRGLQENFQYILADEHQDANASQNRILELLADFHPSPNLFIVGDDKQAIYRFQGASLRNFLYFSEKYPEAKIINLRHNYRSSQIILDAAHGIIGNNPSIPDQNKEKLVSLQIGGRAVGVTETATKEDELALVDQSIKHLIESGQKPEEIAVLYRENSHAMGISTFLGAYGVPHRVESDKDLLSSRDVMYITILCEAINDSSSDQKLAAALFLDFNDLEPATVSLLCAMSSRQKKPLYIMIKSADPKIRKAYDRIKQWSHQARTVPFVEFVDILMRETGILSDIITAKDSLERLSTIQAFHDMVMNMARSMKGFYLADFVHYLGLAREHGLTIKNPQSEHIGGVRLMTAHRAQGLGFDHVFIIHAVDGTWGNRSKRNLFVIPIIEHARDTGRIEDERRLFFVAMTRARREVTVSYPRSMNGKAVVPSQFVGEMPSETVSFERPPARGTRDYFGALAGMPIGKSSSIVNSDFVRKAFLSQGFSVTHLNNFLQCPWRYFFVNLVRIPQAESIHQLYGTAVHSALRALFDSYIKAKTMTKKLFINAFKKELEKAPISMDIFQSLYKRGRLALEGYYSSCDFSKGRRILTEYSVRGVSIAIDGKNGGTLELSGKLDKVEFVDDKNVIVTDYKTAKPHSRNKIEGKTADADGNYKRQLVFYKLLLEGESKKLRMKYGEIDFVEPNDRGIYKKERFDISDDEVEALKKLIISTAKSILKMSFLNSFCDDKECQYCKLGKVLGYHK